MHLSYLTRCHNGLPTHEGSWYISRGPVSRYIFTYIKSGISNSKQEADSFKISANMPYICSKKFETSSENYNFIFLPASRYFVAILNIALRNWNTYHT